MLTGLTVCRCITGMIAALILAVGAGGCGSDRSGADDRAAAEQGLRSDDRNDTQSEGAASSSQDEVRAAYDRYIDNLYAGRWKRACDGFSSAQVRAVSKTLRGANCIEAMRAQHGAVSVQARPWIGKVDMESATRAIGVSKVSPESEGIRLNFVKENGVWKLDGPARSSDGKSNRS